jgi:hypothetical protein
MVYTKKFLASKSAQKMPEWIQKHQTWKTTPKIDKIFPKIGLPNCIEECPEEITDYGTKEPTKKKMHIAFSSDGITGLWDLSTMSMRGVLSCCHWKNAHAKRSSSGYTDGIMSPMTNPNVGIIYLTDGTMTEHGLSINKRSLVYYHEYAGSKQITISQPLAKTTNTNPEVYANRDESADQTKRIFKDFLRSRVKNVQVC